MTDAYVTTTNPWYLARGSYAEFRDTVFALDHDDLARGAINAHLNDFAGRYADYGDEPKDPHGHGKRLPYIGWYWRPLDFAAGHVTIADCGDFIGVCENNKWGHQQRHMTPEEVEKFIDFLWRADRSSDGGGQLSELDKARDAILTECWEWFQTLSMEGSWEG